MFDPYIFLYWYRRLILKPLGLTSPVELIHSAGNCVVGDGDSRKSLLEILKTSCPSLIGIRAWYSGSFWLFNSSHFQVGCLHRNSFHLVVDHSATQTGYSALADFTKVFRIEYERKVGHHLVDSIFIPSDLRLHYFFSYISISKCPMAVQSTST